MTEDENKFTNLETKQDIGDDDDGLSKVDLSDRPNATRWLCKIIGQVITAVKIKKHPDGTFYMSELAILSKIKHMPGKRLMLPQSYLPYIQNQWFAVIPDGHQVFKLSDTQQLYFFGGVGAEMRDDKGSEAIEIPPIKRCFLNKRLDGMEPPFQYVKNDRAAVSYPKRSWKFHFASRGYKETDPPNGGSTRIVWSHASGWYMVLKLFDDNGNYPEEPRTLKFWRTKDIDADYMKWASAAHKFEPTDDEIIKIHEVLKSMWKTIPKELDRIWAEPYWKTVLKRPQKEQAESHGIDTSP